jgi:hypothetical protein
MQSPTPVNARILQENLVLSNYRIPKDTDIVMANGYISTLEKYYPRAKEYMPERWLRDKHENPFFDDKTNPFISLPFGHGPRKCVGMRFALLESEVMLAKVCFYKTLILNYICSCSVNLTSKKIVTDLTGFMDQILCQIGKQYLSFICSYHK